MKTTTPTSDNQDDVCDLGDARLDRRFELVKRRASENPAASFPDMFGDGAELEGAYRFLSNTAVTPEMILAGHVAATVRRSMETGRVLVIHDTTQFAFGGDVPRKGLGPLRSKGQGFFAHVSLAASCDGRRYPFGVVGLHTWVRTKKAGGKGRRDHKRARTNPNGEGLRWSRQVEVVEEQFKAHGACDTTVIHVMDREGDAYSLMAGLKERGRHFVIRVAHDRPLVCTAPQPAKLYEAMAVAVPVVSRSAKLSRRKMPLSPKTAALYPAREERLARLTIRATQVTIQRSQCADRNLPPKLTLNALEVIEVDPPQGVEPVHWRLLTTEPIDQPEQVLRILDDYRTRWLIEELFKSLKSGCTIQERQLESYDALLNALAVFLPIACQLILLRSLAHDDSAVPASAVLTPVRLEVLGAVAKKPLPANPTVKEVLLAIAALGGHLKRNGAPGWMVLWRGFERLIAVEQGWLAARRGRCDES